MGKRVSSAWVTGMNDYNVQKVRFNSSQVEEILEARRQNKSYSQLKEQFNCSKFTIHRVLNFQGVYRQYKNAE